ncbi:hypothetical protein HYT95_03715 [Candidatus Peregrinibacteria bacterium]|nr:hypothetical protein [Candidatus Peregrinibacteria bacterium]
MLAQSSATHSAYDVAPPPPLLGHLQEFSQEIRVLPSLMHRSQSDDVVPFVQPDGVHVCSHAGEESGIFAP